MRGINHVLNTTARKKLQKNVLGVLNTVMRPKLKDAVKLTLSVDSRTKTRLRLISSHYRISISEWLDRRAEDAIKADAVLMRRDAFFNSKKAAPAIQAGKKIVDAFAPKKSPTTS